MLNAVYCLEICDSIPRKSLKYFFDPKIEKRIHKPQVYNCEYIKVSNGRPFNLKI